MNKHLNTLIACIACLGFFLFFYKWYWLNVPLTPPAVQSNWQIEAKFNYSAKNQPAKLELSIPDLQPNFVILQENFISTNYGILTKYIGLNRYAIWTTAKAKGRQTLYYRLLVQQSSPEVINYNIDNLIKKQKELSDTEQTAINAIVDEAKKKAADKISFIGYIINTLNQSNNQNTALLLKRDHTNNHIAEITSTILEQEKIIARPIEGIRINKPGTGVLISWIMARISKSWHFFDPATGEEGLPKNYLIWHIGTHPLYNIVGGTRGDLKISKSLEYTKIDTSIKKSKFLEFALDKLPLQAQFSYKVLLTIPLGALIILLFRNYVGIPTFGTFMPVLIALAFLEMNLSWGVSLFVTIVGFGLVVRFYLETLHLLLVPRLAAILVVVVLFITFIGIITHKLGLEQGSSAALFPMVILTMTIEKMCNLWDERGGIEAITNGCGSIFVAIIAFFVMKQSSIQFLLFNYPEVDFIILAIILLLGQYRGYRLTELSRFKALTQ